MRDAIAHIVKRREARNDKGSNLFALNVWRAVDGLDQGLVALFFSSCDIVASNVGAGRRGPG
jgi:hypothetical protein